MQGGARRHPTRHRRRRPVFVIPRDGGGRSDRAYRRGGMPKRTNARARRRQRGADGLGAIRPEARAASPVRSRGSRSATAIERARGALATFASTAPQAPSRPRNGKRLIVWHPPLDGSAREVGNLVATALRRSVDPAEGAPRPMDHALPQTHRPSRGLPNAARGSESIRCDEKPGSRTRDFEFDRQRESCARRLALGAASGKDRLAERLGSARVRR